MKYRKKPVEVEVIHWTGDNQDEVLAFAKSGEREVKVVAAKDYLQIFTLEGVMTADPGDWIIRGVRGELYPCKPDIFDATYEPVI
jgi:hypothetical protein